MWLRYYRDELRLAGVTGAGLVTLGLLVGGAIWLVYPKGPAQAVTGRVEALGYHETDLGSVPTASVTVDGQAIRIKLPARYGCAIGDTIALKRRANRLGFAYRIGGNPRPCSRV